MTLFKDGMAAVNRVVAPLLSAPVIGDKLGTTMTVLTYTGRKSGKEFSLPVMYRRSGDDVVVGVAMPDKKNWWRNFTGDGAPITVTLDGSERHGHAVSRRDDKGVVSVRIRLDDVSG